MRRRALPATVMLLAAGAALGAGCGGSGDVSAIHAWVSDVPYLPPPPPPPRAGTSAAKQDVSTAAPTTPARPAKPAGGVTSSGAPSDAEIAAELRQAFKGGVGKGSIVNRATLSGTLATAPPTAPAKLDALINAANQVATRPYVYGGGHGGGPEGLFVDNAYDCSGSISFALASAGFIRSPMDSSGLARFGKPGPGKWVTIYANAGHAFMYVAGLRFDTSGRAEHGSRWQNASRTVSGFTVRHPPGL